MSLTKFSKRLISLTLVVFMLVSLMASCSDNKTSVSEVQSKINNVADVSDASSENETETVEETTGTVIESISFSGTRKIILTRTEQKELSFDISADGDFSADDFIVDISDTSVLKLKEKSVSSDDVSLKVKAIKAGRASLKLKAKDGTASSENIKFVVNSVKSVSFRESSKLKIEKGKAKTVVAFAEPKGIIKDDIKVYSSKKSVLKIKDYSVKNSGGKTKITIVAYAVKTGDAAIKIKARQGAANDSRNVHIYKKAVKKPVTSTYTYNDSSYEDDNDSSYGGGTIVYVTPTGKKYHTASCRYVDPGDTSMTESEAISQGYEPCKVCH